MWITAAVASTPSISPPPPLPLLSPLLISSCHWQGELAARGTGGSGWSREGCKSVRLYYSWDLNPQSLGKAELFGILGSPYQKCHQGPKGPFCWKNVWISTNWYVSLKKKSCLALLVPVLALEMLCCDTKPYKLRSAVNWSAKWKHRTDIVLQSIHIWKMLYNFQVSCAINMQRGVVITIIYSLWTPHLHSSVPWSYQKKILFGTQFWSSDS